MIYEVWFTGILPSYTPSQFDKQLVLDTHNNQVSINRRKLLAEFIRRSKQDTFIFIVTQKDGQEELFLDWIKKEQLDSYIMEETESILNPIHPHSGRNLKIYIMMSSEHVFRDMFIEEELGNED